MNCPSARETFPALLDPRTPATAHLDSRAHLAGCPDCQREFAALSQTLDALDALPAPAPSPRLRQNFYAMLEEEKNSAASIRTAARREHRASLFRWILTPALGGVLLLGGFLLGTRYSPPDQTQDETRQRLAELQREMAKTKQLVAVGILERQQDPANDRLRDVLKSARTEQPSKKVLDDLIDALAFDPSTNVRLRAIEALYPHADQQLVRNGVLAALPREQNPLVQLEMIEFVATTHDREATPVLEKMSQDEQIDRSVRDAAKRALTQL